MSQNKLLKVILLVLISLPLVSLGIDLVRLGVAYSTIQNLAYATVRYAATGQFDP
jgi:hypothetical protein